MRRIRHHEHGGPGVLRVEEADVPRPGPGELLVRAEALGVTLPAVRKVRDTASPLPGAPGGEVAGTVAAVGDGVSGFAVGDRVAAIGSYAECVVSPAFLANRVPDDASAVEAVALVRSGHVALAVLHTAALDAAESVLITGAASGVGHLAVQLAKLHGVKRVVAAVGSHAKAEFLRGLGADEVVAYADEDWGEPVDVVLDGVGGGLLPRFLAAAAPGGRLVFFNSGGGTVPAHDLLAGGKSITGLSMGRFSVIHRDAYRSHDAELWAHHRDGRLRAVVHAEIPLADAARAHEIVEARANLGKVVLLP